CDANVVQWKETTSAGRERKTGAHPRFFVETDRECRGGLAVERFETASVRVRGGDPKKMALRKFCRRAMVKHRS
ncbi:MAG: hypothetical protein WBQ19_03440, partial [Terriglobales bacterium]